MLSAAFRKAILMTLGFLITLSSFAFDSRLVSEDQIKIRMKPDVKIPLDQLTVNYPTGQQFEECSITMKMRIHRDRSIEAGKEITFKVIKASVSTTSFVILKPVNPSSEIASIRMMTTELGVLTYEAFKSHSAANCKAFEAIEYLPKDKIIDHLSVE